jgi:hypothetical protein
VHWLGFDDGGVAQQWAPGRDVEISEIYLDVTRARVELSDAREWIESPDADRASEVQGRILSWSDREIRFEIHQGAFDGLGGLTLWILLDDGTTLRVGGVRGLMDKGSSCDRLGLALCLGLVACGSSRASSRSAATRSRRPRPPARRRRRAQW